tara:strand:+ start:702 stop:929 length:228 start_codon:yes stop_codon:yes gene_type:complete
MNETTTNSVPEILLRIHDVDNFINDNTMRIHMEFARAWLEKSFKIPEGMLSEFYSLPPKDENGQYLLEFKDENNA